MHFPKPGSSIVYLVEYFQEALVVLLMSLNLSISVIKLNIIHSLEKFYYNLSLVPVLPYGRSRILIINNNLNALTEKVRHFVPRVPNIQLSLCTLLSTT